MVAGTELPHLYQHLQAFAGAMLVEAGAVAAHDVAAVCNYLW